MLAGGENRRPQDGTKVFDENMIDNVVAQPLLKTTNASEPQMLSPINVTTLVTRFKKQPTEYKK